MRTVSNLRFGPLKFIVLTLPLLGFLLLLTVSHPNPAGATGVLSYYFPIYNNASPYQSSIIIGNIGSASTDVEIDAGGVVQQTSTISANNSIEWSSAGAVYGPVQIKSLGGEPLVVTERVVYKNSISESYAVQNPDVEYVFPWYDDASPGNDSTIALANPGTTSGEVDVYYGSLSLPSHYIVPPGSNLQIRYAGYSGGPVKLISTNGQRILASELTIFNNSFNQTMSTSEGSVSNDYFYPIYDANTIGHQEWVVISNANSFSIYGEITIGGNLKWSGTIPGGSTVFPTPFFGVIGGPVEVRAWTDASKTSPANFLTSERLVTNGNFIEHPGIPASTLSSTYYLSRYDHNWPGFTSQLTVANVSSQAADTSVYLGNSTIPIASMNLTASSALQPSIITTPPFKSGPIRIASTGGKPIIAGQEYVFTSKNGKIAFSRRVNNSNNWNIFVMNADGFGQTNLLSNSSVDATGPAWSPDGTKIAYSNTIDGYSQINVMNADGSDQTQLTNSGGSNPSWSPDGTKIAFNSSRNGNSEIFVMNADGSGQTNLTNGTENDFQPAWSPDGTKIAYSNSFDIYVVNADGSGQTRLTNMNNGWSSEPAWSPDGTKIAYSNILDIYVMNADGSGQTNLTNGTENDFQPAWSPDDTKIAFTSNLQIFVINADGSGQTQLTNSYDGDSFQPAWGVKFLQTTNIFPSGWIGTNTLTIQADLAADESGINSSTLKITIDGNELSNCTLNAFHVSCPTSGLSEGQHFVHVTYITNDGVSGIGDSSFNVDLTPPAIEIPAWMNGNTINASLSDNGSGVNQAAIYEYLDGSSQSLAGCSTTSTSISCPAPGLSNGAHSLLVTAQDAVGNSTTVNGSFNIDTTPPTISQISPTGLVNATTATVSAYYADAESGINTSSVKLLINGVDVTSQSSVFANHIVYFNKNGGPQFVHLEVSDNAGNDQYANWPYQVKEDNYFPWYDNINGLTWLLMAQPTGTGSASFDSSLGNTPEGSLSVADGTMGYLRIANGFGGPASIATFDTRSLISERSLFGNSFEEIWATPYDQLDSHYYWPAYFGGEAGVKEWVLVSNPPENGEDVKVDLMMSGGTIEAGHVIHRGDTWTPTYPANYDPVEVRAYSAATGNPADARKVIASERIMFNGSFNEMPGIPASKLSNDNLWPWFDSIDSADYLGIGNPNSQTIYLFVFLAGVRQGGIYGQPLNPGQTIAWSMPNVMNGPVEVKGCYDDSETCFQPAKIFSSQIVRFGPSYEETAGTSPADLKPNSNWTWYDEITPGSYNWVLVSNPNLVSVIYYQISIAGHLDPNNPADPYYASSHGYLGPQQKVTPQFPGIMGGPVQVKGCFYPFAADGSCLNPAPVLASQRVVWNGYFNEVVGKGM